MPSLSTVVEELQELDLIFRSGSDLDVVEKGYASTLIHAISSHNYVLECEALKGLGDLYLKNARRNVDKVKNFNKACSLYTELSRHSKTIEEKQVAQHRIHYAEKCTKLLHSENLMKMATIDYATTPLAVSMTLQKMEGKAKTKGYGMTPLVECYTNSFVKAIVKRNELLKTESLKSIGDLYLEKGRFERDEAAFTKSAGLYRAALDRCEDSDGRETLKHRIKYVEKVKEKERKKAEKRLETGPTGYTVVEASSEETQEVPESTYRDKLQEGCSALEAGDLDTAEHKFAAALKAVHLKGQHWKEAEPLCKLSDVYLKRGERFKDGGDFTKAAALSNAALVRSKTEDREGIKQTIQKITQSFVQHVLCIEQTVPMDDVEKHKSVLSECRNHVGNEIKRVEKQIDPYSLDDNDPKIREEEMSRVEAIKALFDTIVHQRRTFIAGLVDECIEVMGPPPCKYAMIGLGSHATGLVTPYSDLEFAILIERETENSVKFFYNLTQYLHLKVINLGETILPAMAIKSLNDFESKDKLGDWFYDSLTPRGFSFDGAMPHACKTPLGRGKTCLLIRTPCNMANVLEDDVTLHLKKGYHLATVLGNVSLITGEQGLVDKYMAMWDHRLKESDKKLARLLADEMLNENREKFQKQNLTDKILDVKKEIYRFSSLAVSCWALFSGIQPTTIWETIQKMHEKGAISDESKHHLMVLVSISAELRLRTYMNNRGQVENMSALSSMPTTSNIVEISNNVFYISNSKQLMRYYYTAIPLKHFVSQVGNRQSLPTEGPSVLFDKSSKVQAEIYLSLCDYHSSKECMKQTLQEEQRRHGNDAIHPDIADLLKKLGNACFHLGDYKEAVTYFERLLQMVKGIHGKGTAHSDITVAFNNLGNVWSQIGDHMKALSCHEQSLQMSRTIYGEKTAHSDIAYSLNNLGTTWSDLGGHRKALSYFEQSLQMMRNIHAKSNDHPNIAHLLQNVGNARKALGDNKIALSYHEQSLKMRLSIYGEATAHPAIADSLMILGNALSDLGNHREAVSYHEQALQMSRRVFGEGYMHPLIAMSLSNLGNVWSDLGDNRKAVSYQEQALRMKLGIYGEATAHPDIVSSLNNLGNTWSEMRYYRKAISYYEQALQMMKSIIGVSKAHPDFVPVLNNMGAAWSYLGDHKKAFKYHENSLHMAWDIYGKRTEHPTIARSLNNLGNALRGIGEHRKAVSYFEQSLQMRQSIYGKSNAHSDIAQSFKNLGAAWSDLGDYRKAHIYHEQSLQMNKSIYGEDTAHPNIAVSLDNLGHACSRIGDHRKAVSYYEQAVQMELSLFGVNTDNMILVLRLGLYLRKLGDHRRATKYIVQASRMRKMIKDLKSRPTHSL